MQKNPVYVPTRSAVSLGHNFIFVVLDGNTYMYINFYARSENCEKRLSVCPHGTTRVPLDGFS